MSSSNSGCIGCPLAVQVRGASAAAVALALPVLSIYPILAQKYHFDGFCAAALLFSTVLSFVTISANLWLLRAVPGWTG
jgi:hypothetical protein